MPHPSPLPYGLQNQPFSAQDAFELGVTKARLRAQDLSAPFPGVRTHGPAETTLELVRAYATKLEPGQHFSHTTAAALLGLRMPPHFTESLLHAPSLAPMRAPRGTGIRGHNTEKPARLTLLDGDIPVSSALDTWCDLRATLRHRDLVIMGDGLVARKNPLVTMDALAAAVGATWGTRGARILRTAASAMRPGTDSAPETDLRLIVVDTGFPEPEVNGEIRNRYGAVIAHGDLVFRPSRTILEYDGGQHRTDEQQFHIDVRRLDDSMEERWRVIRIDKFLLANRATLIAKIHIALTQGGWSRYHHPAR